MYEEMGIAIVGCGGIANAHCETVLATDEGISLYMYDPVAERAKLLCERYGGKGCFGSYEEVLQSKEVDVVDICVPHDVHVGVAAAAAQAGKHILLEKPIARTIAEADEILDAVEKAGVRLFVAECWRFFPTAVKARELMDQGVIGAPFLIQVNSLGLFTPPTWRREKERMGGGVLIDRGIHIVHYMRLVGGEVTSVSVALNHTSIMDMEGEDTASVLLKFESGVTGQLTVSWGTHCATSWHWLIVYGSEGTMFDMNEGFYVYSTTNSDYNDDGKPVRLFDTMLEPYMIPAEMQHFIDRMRDGEEFAVTGAEARADLEIVEAAYLSAERGETVEAPLNF